METVSRDDSNGEIIGRRSPSISVDQRTLAERILDAVADAGYGEIDDIIPATADALGEDCIEHLKQITNAWVEAPAFALEN